MFKTISYRLGLLILFLSFVFFLGCGGSESGLDGDASIAVEMAPYDSGDPGTLTSSIDVVQVLCKYKVEGGATPEDPVTITKEVEAFYDAAALVTFHYIFYCPTCPPGADETYIIDSYTVEYIPLKSPDGAGGFYLPPKLTNLDQRISNQVVLTKDFKTAERSVFLVPFQTKDEYVNRSFTQGTFNYFNDLDGTTRVAPFFGLYSIRLNFYGKNRAGNSFTITSTAGVSFGPYNRCKKEE